MIIIRRAEISDAKALLEYLKEFLSENCSTVPTLSKIPSLEDEIKWMEVRSEETGAVFIAVEDSKIIGLIETSIPKIPEFKHNCELGMSVLADYRNKGIGRKLLLTFFDWAERQELERVELNVFSNNTAAIYLYKSLEFKEDGRRIKAVKLKDGTYCDLVHMSRRTSHFSNYKL